MKETIYSVFDAKNGTSVTIRQALVSDAPALQALARHVNGHFDMYHVDTMEEFREDISYWERLIIRHQERPNDILFVATIGSDIVGMCEFSVPRQQRLSHWGSFSINVHEDHHGQGIGRHLLTTLLQWATAHPALEVVTLKVHADNHRAIRLYESLGFVRTGLTKHAIKYSDILYRDAAEMYLSVKTTIQED